MAKKRIVKTTTEPQLFEKQSGVNLFRATQIIIGATSLLMGIFLLLAYGYLTPVVGLAMLFGIFALMTAMRG